MKTEIRVLIVVPNLRVSNGVASYAMNYYRTLDHCHIHMDFATYKMIDSPYIDEIKRNGDNVFVLPSIKKTIKHVRTASSIIKNGNYDIVHDNSLLITLPLMLIAKRRVPKRILHSHSAQLGETKSNEKRNKIFLPLLLNTITNRVACSNKAGKALFKEEPFAIIPNVIHPEKYKFNEEIRKRVRLKENSNDKIIIGTVARLTDAKNPFFAIDVIEKALQHNKNIVYWWIGSGALDMQVARYVHDKNLENSIRLFGSRSDVSELLQALDLFFLPSKSEGFGLACLEASATGLPCLVSEEFPEEINVTGKVRFISTKKSKEEWANALLEELVNNNNRLDSYKKIQCSIYSDTFSGKKLFEYYQSLFDN